MRHRATLFTHFLPPGAMLWLQPSLAHAHLACGARLALSPAALASSSTNSCFMSVGPLKAKPHFSSQLAAASTPKAPSG